MENIFSRNLLETCFELNEKSIFLLQGSKINFIILKRTYDESLRKGGEREREDDRPKYGSVNDDRRRRDGERREREKGKFVPGPPCGNYLSLVLDESTVTNRQPGKILPFIVAPFGLAILHPRQPATAAPLTTFISDCSFAALYAHCR